VIILSSVIDITGTIYEGMWDLEGAPPYKIRPFPKLPWLDYDVYMETFEMHSQTGTYLETPGHFFGYENTYLIDEVDVAEITNRPCVVLDVGNINPENKPERMPVTLDNLLSCNNANMIQEGDAILICTHWGRMWEHKDYLNNSPTISLEAMKWLVSKKPFLLGGDIPRWENINNPVGIFPVFEKSGCLLMGPSINLNLITKPRVLITVLPLKIKGTFCAPCRAVIIED
jgi:kynurenine formamidase